MTDAKHPPNLFLNYDITLEEVRAAVNKSKPGKSVGVEEIPNEALKAPSLLNVPLSLFGFCFNYSVVPSVWYKSIIKPIPKSLGSDLRIPLNYRGISLLSTVYKLYSSILNVRLTRYLETVEYLVDEQNGF